MSPPIIDTAPSQLFSERGADYARSRPTYPAGVIDAILEGLGDPSRLTAADIGAGTGIASRLLTERGVRVTAVEPSRSMRNAAERHAMIEFREGAAEQTNLPAASVDLVTCFQAFHWFNPEPTLAEFRRVLRSSGRLALIWNNRANDEFLKKFASLIRESRSNHPAVGKRAPNAKNRVSALMASPDFRRVRRQASLHQRELDLSGLIAYAQSKSYVPREGQAHRRLIGDLQALHARWADERGVVSVAYCAAVYTAEPRRRFAGWRRLNRVLNDLLPASKKLD